MTINSNTTAIVPINSQKGIDGSTSIPTIQDGYCINAENVDLSTANEIKKRKGYAKYCSELPVRSSDNVSYSNGRDKVLAILPQIRSVICTIMDYDAAGLAFLDLHLGYQSFRDITKTSGYSIVQFTGPSVGRYGMIEDHECYFTEIVPLAVFTSVKPIKVLSPDIMIIRHKTAATGYTLNFTRAPALRSLKRVTSIVDQGANVLKIYTDEAVSADATYYQIFEPLLGIGTVTSVTLGESFLVSFTVSTTSIPVSLMKFYTAFFPRRVERATGIELNTSAPYIKTLLETYVEYSDGSLSVAQAYYMYGTGFEVFPNALETYFSYTDQVDKLVAVHNGRIYKSPYPELRYDVGPYNMAYPAATAAQTLTKNQGRYRITFANAHLTYMADDIIKIERQNSDTGVETYFSMKVSAVDSTGMYVIEDESNTVPTSILTGEILHWTRYTQSITLSSSVIGSDSVILIDGVSVHEVAFSNGTTVLFDSPILISSKSVIQLFDFWKSYAKVNTSVSYDLQEHFQMHQRGADNVLGSAKFIYGSYFADNVLGVQRYDGVSRFSLSMDAPVVVGKRSVPGSVGVFPVVTGGNNKKVGDPVNTVFTFVYYDNNGFTNESDYSEPGSGYIVPNAAIDGSDYLELVEYRIQSPITFPSKGTMYLNAYVSVTENQTNTDLKYLLYKSVKVYDSSELRYLNSSNLQTGGTEFPTIIITVGEIPGSALTTAPELPAITSPSLAIPQAKYLLSAANRIIALNVTSFPYVKLEVPTTLFKNNQFSAFCNLTLNSILYFTAPLGVIDNTVGVPGEGSIIVDQSQATMTNTTSGDNFYYGPNYDVLKVDWKNIAVARKSLTLSYTNAPDKFNATVYGNGATKAANVLSTRAIARQVHKTVDLKGKGISLSGTVFNTVVSAAVAVPATTWFSNAIALTASTAWTDPNLTTAGQYITSPTNMAGHVLFEQITIVKSSITFALRSTNDDIYVQATAGGSDNPVITLCIKASGFAVADWGWAPPGGSDPIDAKLIVIQGIDGIFSFSQDVNSPVLSTDKDIVWRADWKCVYPSTGTTTEYHYTLTPFLAKGSGVPTVVDAVEAVFIKIQVRCLAGGTTNNTNTPIEIFRLTGGATYSGDLATAGYQSNFSGLSTPSNLFYIETEHLALPPPNIFAIGDRCVLELGEGDSLPSNYPKLTGVSLEVVAVVVYATYVKLTVKILPPTIFGGTGSILLSAESYLVNVTKLFTIQFDGSAPTIPYLRFYAARGASWTPVDATTMNFKNYGFLLVRGSEFNSCCMELSGPVKLHVGTVANSKADGTIWLGVPYIVGDSVASHYDIDYSKITGVKYSCLMVSQFGQPIPVPRRLQTNSNYSDLALPLCSSTPEVAEDAFTQVVKRFEMISPFFKSIGTDKYTTDVKYNEIICVVSLRPSGYDVLTVAAVGNITSLDGAAFNGYTLHGTASDGSISSAKISTVQSTLNARRDNRGNLIYWTNSVFEDNADAAILPSFRYNNQKALNTEDDSDITGAVAFQGGALIFKKNSVWRITFDESGTPTLTRVQSTVGTISPNNLVANNDVCYFTNDQGVYYTDGTKVYHELRMNRHFTNHVDKSDYKFRRCAGFSDMESKNINLGLDYYSPYNDKMSTQVEGQCVYCYNDGVLGWSVNTKIPSLKWIVSNHNFYFINSIGNVCKVRNENSLTKFRDGEQAIQMNLKTRYLTSEDTYRFKFYRNFLFQFGDTTNFNMEAYYAIDFKTYEHPLEIYPQEKATTFNGIITYGTEKYMKILRETMAQRVANVSIRLSENSVDTDAVVFNISMEGWLHNTRLISQKTTPGGSTRT